jgi:hypothetical protein
VGGGEHLFEPGLGLAVLLEKRAFLLAEIALDALLRDSLESLHGISHGVRRSKKNQAVRLAQAGSHMHAESG